MNFVKRLKSLRHDIYLGVCHMLPIKKNKIILWSDNFKSFGCSPKYIALYLSEHFGEKYDIVWVLGKDRNIPSDVPKNIRIARYFSMKYIKEISTAKVIICNARTNESHFFRKRKGQYYIQTWHSSLRLKMIEGDAMLPEDYIEVAKKDSEKIDLLLSGCRFSTDIFRRAFWYDGEILEKGTPRCDGFFGDNSAVSKKVYDFYGIDKSKKLALYAPTFRNDKKASFYGMDFEMLGKALGEDFVIGLRLHPNLNESVEADGCISMSNYPDMQELLQSCDLLITDYSSSMFDMVVADKKCVLYVPDMKDYVKNERGLYFDMEALPFPKAENMEELCAVIGNFEHYNELCHDFKEQIGSFENGNAAEEVAMRINKITGR